MGGDTSSLLSFLAPACSRCQSLSVNVLCYSSVHNSCLQMPSKAQMTMRHRTHNSVGLYCWVLFPMAEQHGQPNLQLVERHRHCACACALCARRQHDTCNRSHTPGARPCAHPFQVERQGICQPPRVSA